MSERRSRPHPLRDLRLAFSFMTVLPLGGEWPEDGVRGMAAYFPWVGVFLGGVGALIGWGAHARGADDPLTALLAGMLVIVVWALLGRFLHWDGLADVADALGCHDRSRRLDIMKDSLIGPFGVLAIVLVASVQVVSAAILIRSQAFVMLFAAPIVARSVAAFAAYSIRPARTTGLGAAIAGHGRLVDALPLALALLLLGEVFLGLHEWVGLGVVVGSLLLGYLLSRALARAVGGLTGDILGASILVTEATTLVAAAFLLR